MDNRVLVIGLPQSGKTTFLAALWHVVNEDDVDPKLKLRNLQGDYKHLNSLRDMWLQRREFERTKRGDEKTVVLRLEDVTKSHTLDLSFPDYSGETFRMLWRDRMCSQELASEIRSTRAVLLFIHADRINRPWLLTDMTSALAQSAEITEARAIDVPETQLSGNLALSGEEGGSVGETEMTGTKSVETEAVVPYDPNKSPTQVQIVDLLQAMQRPPLGPLRRRLAVILSAWDKVEKFEQSPERWLETKFPYLHQFIANDRGQLETRVFGVSAQGGDYENDAAKLDKVLVPSQRIKVTHSDGESHDISEPVFWSLGL